MITLLLNLLRLLPVLCGGHRQLALENPGPRRSGLGGDVEGQDPAPMVSEDDQDEEHAQPSGGNGNEVDRHQIPDMVREERPPGLRRRCRALRDQARDGTLGHVDAELQEFAMDRGAPHSGLAAAIWRTRAMISALTDGRPIWGLLESFAQESRRRRRCQRTVSEITMMRACRHPAHTWDRETQKSRSLGCSLGRLSVFL